MKTMFKALCLAAASVGAVAIVPQIAAAQAVPGIATADLEEAVGKSNAAVLANNQVNITHKAVLDQAQVRANAINQELNAAATALQTAARAPNANQAALQQQSNDLQRKKQAGEAEVANITRPADVARAYAAQQIQAKLEQAVRSAMTKKRVSMLVKPEALVLGLPGTDITPDIIAELNTLVPSVGITPPPGWPQQQGAAPAAGAAPRPVAPAAGTAPKPAPSGR